ncbi:hypothetical protein EK21DRAFT_116682 [Setomelanomma holmii]|uniref:Uncharacterized protein n=1 Tax=Setomelanomma holmii TaxID=210430 RepID=A0A9P4GZM5_9PLEO|nr:hypothetical protein EK21DRAFT_116682 [Setomelanomma holmii]
MLVIPPEARDRPRNLREVDEEDESDHDSLYADPETPPRKPNQAYVIDEEHESDYDSLYTDSIGLEHVAELQRKKRQEREHDSDDKSVHSVGSGGYDISASSESSEEERENSNSDSGSESSSNDSDSDSSDSSDGPPMPWHRPKKPDGENHEDSDGSNDELSPLLVSSVLPAQLVPARVPRSAATQRDTTRQKGRTPSVTSTILENLESSTKSTSQVPEHPTSPTLYAPYNPTNIPYDVANITT